MHVWTCSEYRLSLVNITYTSVINVFRKILSFFSCSIEVAQPDGMTTARGSQISLFLWWKSFLNHPLTVSDNFRPDSGFEIYKCPTVEQVHDMSLFKITILRGAAAIDQSHLLLNKCVVVCTESGLQVFSIEIDRASCLLFVWLVAIRHALL